MTMIPATPLPHHHHNQNLSNSIKKHFYGGGYASGGGCSQTTMAESIIRSDHQSSVNIETVAGSISSSSKVDPLPPPPQDHDDVDDDDEGWLQLSIGGLTAAGFPNNNNSHKNGKSNNKQHQEEDDYHCDEPDDEVLLLNHQRNSGRGGIRGGMIELDLLPLLAAGSASTATTTSGSSYISKQEQELRSSYNISSSSFQAHHQEINWQLANYIRPFPRTNLVSSITDVHPSPSLASLVVPVPVPVLPFQVHAGQGAATSSAPGIDFRVIDPPPRLHSAGIWFMLRAAQNQAKEPFLPQISKSFLRIKDGGMTMLLVIKYLVNKLKLKSESEVEIRCRGQQVEPFLTLHHVRDNIWIGPNDVVTLLPDSSTADHIMVLHYGRSAS
ncbi:hypothetical protein ACH5RR_030891 [Cinchona calisaya]|uniref:receptor protein-tyrosine kinase n=1 Tax=Cinchona calisaya TaxID=153742 RepID=A0ABD2YVZ8_9GENT